MANIAILGSGGWGMAMAVNQLQNGHALTLWSPYAEEIESLRNMRGNARLLPGIVLPEQIGLTTDLSCAAKADICIIAVPSGAVRSVAAALREVVSAPIVVSLAKGIENGSFMRMSEVILSELPKARVTVLSGPSHAEEVARGIPTLCVVASEKLEDACRIQDEMMNPTLRLYTSTDLAGVELGGAIKNVMALAVGMLDGMGMGDQYQGCAHDPRDYGNDASRRRLWRPAGDVYRTHRHRRPNCNLHQPAFAQQAGRRAHRLRYVAGAGGRQGRYGGGIHHDKGRLCRRQGAWDRNAHRGGHSRRSVRGRTGDADARPAHAPQ